MSAYQVAVVADGASSLAGTAVVRIDGLREWPPHAILRLLPIDEQTVPPKSEGWPWGDITPLRVLPTATGVDVVLGPDVAGCAQLIPGTPISVVIPSMQLEVEARWPSLTPTVRRRNVAVAMSAGQLLAAKAEREQAEKVLAARRMELAEFALRAQRSAPVDGARAGGPQRPPTAAAEGGAATRGAETSQLARLLPMRRGGAPTATTAIVERAAQPGGPAGAADTGTPPVAVTRASSAPLVTPVREPMSVGGMQPRRRLRGVLSFVAGMATMAAAVVGVVNFAPPASLPQGLASAFIVAPDPDQLALADLAQVFKDVATAAGQSPQHKAASGVDVATALSLADHSLRGERTPAETDEAVFWLKRALAGSFGGADVGWALTQLGTIYATPGTPEHNYVKAHTIWQLAAVQGDPVAHCFLGALYEHGLGVQQNRKIALQHYKIADAMGACRSAKDAVARLSE